MKRLLIHSLRGDSYSILKPLAEDYGFSLVGQDELIRSTPPAPKMPELPWEVEEGWWSQVAGTLDGLEHIRDEDLAGAIVWNSVTPTTRALALGVRKRGKPVFEIDHGAFATYMHGHFENDPASTHIFCSPEQERFLRDNGYEGEIYPTGRPCYDPWKGEDKIEARKELGLPPFQPLVLRTTTWTHGMSRWSDSDILIRDAEVAFLKGAKALQHVFPVSFVYSIRPNLGLEPKRISKDFDDLEIQEAYVTKDTPLYHLLQCADLVVSPKSSAAVEAVLLDRPAIVVDFRPQLDVWAWAGKGILACRKPEDLPLMMLRCLSDEDTIQRLEKERKEGKPWFNGPGNATQEIARIINEVSYEGGKRTVN